MISVKEKLLERIKNGTCEVLGLGISNVPLCRYLISHGASVVGRDKKSEDQLGEIASELKTLGVRLVTGDSYLEGLGGDDPGMTLIFRSPGIRPDTKELSCAVRQGAILTSEMELFFELTPTHIIAVTGSDGKTTTTTLIGELLQKEFESDGGRRRVYIGGNIGEPLLPYVDTMTQNDYAVVELSSFQLMTMERSAERAVVTNVTPNHLNWHTDMEEYARAKRNVYIHNDCCKITLNAENYVTSMWASEKTFGSVTLFSSKRSEYNKIQNNPKDHAVYEKDGYIVYFDGTSEEEIIKTQDIFIPGRHNVENYMAAISATYGIVSKRTVKSIANSFRGVEHRCELVRELNGVRFYNSSIDSSPTRTCAALSSFGDKKLIVICGGKNKNLSFEPLAKALSVHAKAVVLTGNAMNEISCAIKNCEECRSHPFTVVEEQDFKKAVLAASELADCGDVVILSPACTSFDAFRNFEERGRYFKDIINLL